MRIGKNLFSFRQTLVESKFRELHHLWIPEVEVGVVYIAKNACTLVKTAMLLEAKAQGYFEMESKSSIVQRPHEFSKYISLHERKSPARRQLFYVVTRDPVKRLVSAYIDKFLVPESLPDFSRFVVDSYQRKTRAQEFSFQDFVTYLERTGHHHLNEHWRPQALHLMSGLRYEFVPMDEMQSHNALGSIIRAAVREVGPKPNRTRFSLSDPERFQDTDYRILRRSLILNQEGSQGKITINSELTARIATIFSKDYLLRNES